MFLCENFTVLFLYLFSVLSNIPNNTILAKSAVCQEPDRTFDTRAVVVMLVLNIE